MNHLQTIDYYNDNDNNKSLRLGHPGCQCMETVVESMVLLYNLSKAFY